MSNISVTEIGAMFQDTISPLSVIVALVLGGILLLWVHHTSYGWRGTTKSGAKLPGGSFGWPIIGETIEMGMNPRTFAAARIKKYGKIFKTNLLTKPTICGTTPEFHKFVLSNPKVFPTGYIGPGILELLGPKAFVGHDGPNHVGVKMLLLRAIKAEALRTKFDVLEDIIVQNMVKWEGQGTVIAYAGAQKIALDIGSYLLLGDRNFDETEEGREIRNNFFLLHKAVNSAPVKLPGTNYSNGLKASARMGHIVKALMEKREREGIKSDDFLGVMLSARHEEESKKEVKELSDELIVENGALLIFSAYGTSAGTLVWILKHMIDNPDIFGRLQAEQQEILKSRGPGAKLVWEDFAKMNYASKFLQEIHRYVSVGPFMQRRVTEDVEYEGHLIPKGYWVFAYNSYLHHDPDYYPEPEKFNPERFNAIPKPFSYVPFGSGTHLCAGLDIANVTALVFIHHLTTTFKVERVGPDRGMYFKCHIMPKDGYPIKLRRRTAGET